eukprot:TRINITY_DN1866_c6_g1_i1.p1 TRINITY_DN1866_c6_g1~~TRINITY_DN1866_c6_g1_i1.p1  ORF type:complete len:544 (+),score=145.64 TRINITY_DN1866_c6_g1_i1:171-1802(+)
MSPVEIETAVAIMDMPEVDAEKLRLDSVSTKGSMDNKTSAETSETDELDERSDGGSSGDGERSASSTGPPRSVSSRWADLMEEDLALLEDSFRPISVEANDEGGVSSIRGCTTLMLQGVPLFYSENKLLNHINKLGFQGKYDFLYLPLENKGGLTRGYAFINFVNEETAEKFYVAQSGKPLSDAAEKEPISILPGKYQGFEENCNQTDCARNNRKGRRSFGKPLLFQPQKAATAGSGKDKSKTAKKSLTLGVSTHALSQAEGAAATCTGDEAVAAMCQMDCSQLDMSQYADWQAMGGADGQWYDYSNLPMMCVMAWVPASSLNSYGQWMPGMEGYSGSMDMSGAMGTHAGEMVTVMMRNLPNKYSQQMLFEEINETGFEGTFDFLYLPIDPETKANKGYAFVSFMSPADASRFQEHYQGRSMKHFNSHKTVSICPAALQGFKANYDHYSKSQAAKPMFLPQGTTSAASTTKSAAAAPAAAAAVAPAPAAVASPANEASSQSQSDADAECGDCSAMSFKFCPFCGGARQPEFKFCVYCGKSVTA